MYAAAGGASIANRRKQKRLQLRNRRGAEGAIPVLPGRIKVTPPTASSSSTHHPHFNKFARAHLQPQQSSLSSSARLPAQASSLQVSSKSSSHAFHASIKHQRHRCCGDKFQRLAPPVSPIIQFPISPPPLSLESPEALVKSNNFNNNFPFPPPPSFLDLRVSPSSSELQCGGGPGKAAWQGCNRSSPFPLSPISPHICRGEGYNKNKQCEAHRRWMKRNRIRDASYCYGSSGDEDDEDGRGNHRRRGEVNAAVNTVLYAGLGTTALGLVISFVGTGEKGFLSPELKLVGPSLLCAGLLCCLFRVLLCLCRISADKRKEKARKERSNGPLPTALLLLPITQQQQQQQPQHHQPQYHTRQKPCPTTSSATKGHELLLSPAQLPE